MDRTGSRAPPTRAPPLARRCTRRRVTGERTSIDAARAAGAGPCRPRAAAASRLSLGARPGLVDPRVGRGRLALRPTGRRGDVTDRDRDDALGVEDGERIIRKVLAEHRYAVYVAEAVAGADVEVGRWDGR